MKVALIGGNGFGLFHAESYRRLGIPFSVFDRNDEVIETYRRDYKIEDSFKSIDAAINSDSDIVDIVLPHNMHRKTAVEAMRNGKHVLIEKPIATNIPDAREMVDEAKKNNVKLMVSEQYYFDESIRKALTMAGENAIGKVHSVIVREQRTHNKPGWRNRPEIMGGGALIDGGIHLIDVILNIGGKYSEIFSTSYNGGSPLKGEDSVMATFRFQSGASGFLFYSWAYPFAPSVPAYEIVGTEGSIVEDMGSRPGDRFNRGLGKRYVFGMPVLNGKRIDVKVNDVFDSEIAGFIHSVKRDCEPPFSNEDAIRDLGAVMQIYGK